MKYYYSKSNEDGVYKKIFASRNIEKLNDDHDKLVIISEDNIFHVMTFEESYCNDEKDVFDRSELVKYIRNNNKNVYFFNCNKANPYFILRDVNDCKDEEVIDVSMIPNSIYTIKDNEILKINAIVDKSVIKDAIREEYIREYSRDGDFKKVTIKDFVTDPKLLKLYNLPLIDKYNSFKIPEYSYTHPSLFYILNGIYSNRFDDKISLSEQNIKDLNLESFSEDKDIIEKIVKNIEVNIDKRYDLTDFSKSLNYMEDLKKQENDVTMELKKARTILKRAEQNKEAVNNLGLLEKLKYKKIQKIKPVTK